MLKRIFILFFSLSHASSTFDNLRVICVGCSSGIGKATAEILMQGGAKVVISSRRQEILDQIVMQYPNFGYAVKADAGNSKELQHLVAASKEFFDKKTITGLVWAVTGTNVGMFDKLGSEITITNIKMQMELNVYGLVVMTELIKEDLRKSAKVGDEASIVSISSINSQDTVLGTLPYSISKAAQDKLIQELSLEFGSFGIRLNSVLPATIQTPIFEIFGENKDKLLKEAASRQVLQRVGKPHEVGELIALLLSSKSSFITGQNIRIDGGSKLLGAHFDLFSDYDLM